MRGAFGFVIPGETDLRFQLTTSYVNAGAAQSNGIISGSDSRLSDPNIGCGMGADCLGGLLSGTSYRAWQSELKTASDLSFNNVSLSPFITAFAKNAQSELPVLEGTAGTGWRDLGSAVGIDSTIDITNRMLFGLRGSLGAAYRSTSFSSVQGGTLYLDQQNATTANSNGGSFLATVEANLIWKPQTWQTTKAYVGFQFDSRAPLAPDQISESGGGGGGQITYESVRSYYFGASLKMDLDSRR